MRRDRFLLAVTLTTVLVADVYFVLLPRLRAWYHLSRNGCTCQGVNASFEYEGQTPPQWIINITAEPESKLERLFSHPLYNIRTPELALEERLLEEEELMGYYRRKVSRWERCVHVTEICVD